MPDPLPDKNWGKNRFTPEDCQDENRGNFGKMPDVKIRIKIRVLGGCLSHVRMTTNLGELLSAAEE